VGERGCDANAGCDGRVVYIFGQGMPVMVCARYGSALLNCRLASTCKSQPQIGDSRRWEITPVLSGSGLDETPLLIVKPIETGLETDLIVSTDRRTYVFRLVSDPVRFVSRLAFQYPGEDSAKWVAFQARQDAQSTMPRPSPSKHARKTSGLAWCQWLTTPWTIFTSTTSSTETRPTVPSKSLTMAGTLT